MGREPDRLGERGRRPRPPRGPRLPLDRRPPRHRGASEHQVGSWWLQVLREAAQHPHRVLEPVPARDLGDQRSVRLGSGPVLVELGPPVDPCQLPSWRWNTGAERWSVPSPMVARIDLTAPGPAPGSWARRRRSREATIQSFSSSRPSQTKPRRRRRRRRPPRGSGVRNAHAPRARSLGWSSADVAAPDHIHLGVPSAGGSARPSAGRGDRRCRRGGAARQGRWRSGRSDPRIDRVLRLSELAAVARGPVQRLWSRLVTPKKSSLPAIANQRASTPAPRA